MPPFLRGRLALLVGGFACGQKIISDTRSRHRLAGRDRISIRRTSDGGAQSILKVSATQLSKSGSEPFLIQSGDVITVGEKLF